MSTTQAPLLWVPLKSTSDVSYASSIRQTIIQTYQESADAYKEEIAALDRCRQDALRGSAGSDVTGRDLLYKYFGQLELLELRFPEVRVPFPWKDAFTGKEISQLSLAYEKASVIFNIAATLSSLAAQQNRTSTEGIRRAFHNFRCAAGMFTYINDNFLHAPSTDLSREVVKVLVQLMIAQATEVFVERMTEEKEKKPFGLRARVSTQAAFLYGSVLEDVKELASKGIFDRSWTWLVQCKHKYFVSLAQYQRSLADSASSKHGDALTRLQIAETAAKDASRFAASFSAAFTTISGSGSATLPSDAAFSLVELTKTHLALCVEAKVSEQRDNDLIYHDAQPSEAALPAIEKSSVGDPIAIQEVYGAPEVQKVVGQDIFIRLVPLSVHQSSSLYSEEKAKLVRTEGERCEMADTELSTVLDFMGLPASLDKFNDLLTGSGRSTRLDELTDPPGQVSEWAQAVQQAMDTKPIETLWEKLTSLRDKTHRDLVNVERSMDSDARDCEHMRVKYDHLWEQQPSSNLTKAWRHNIKSHWETLEAARKSDNQVDGIWKPAKADIDILADRSGESLRRLYAESISVQQDTTNGVSLLDVGETSDEEAELTQMGNMLTSIQENISRLHALKKERQGVLKDLKERIQADDISQLLILNRKAQNIEPALFAAELEKFRAHSGRISATLHLQTTAIQELTAQYKSLSDSKRGKDLQDRWTNASKKRSQATSRLQRAYEAHDEVRSGLSKGIEFYQEIQAAVAELQRQVEGFVSSRATERMRMATKAEAERDRNANSLGEMKPLEHQMAGMNLANPSASSVPSPLPPPLPPQPKAWQTAPTSSPAGPAYQSFPSYGPGSEQTQPHTPQSVYASPSPSAPYSSPPPASDPYASLGAFGSMFPPAQPPTQSASPAVQQYAGQPQAPPPPHQQYPGSSPALASLPPQYAGTAQAPPQQYANQSHAPIHAQQYPGQSQTGPAATQPFSGPSYGPYGTLQGLPEALGAPAVPPKHVLPPPPPPVTYQTTVAQPYRASQTYTPSPLPPSTHHAHPHLPSNGGSQQYSPAPSAQPPPASGHQQLHYSSPGPRAAQQYMGPSSQTYGHPAPPGVNGPAFGASVHQQPQQQYGYYQGIQGDQIGSLAQLGPGSAAPSPHPAGGVWQQNHDQHQPHQGHYPPPPPPPHPHPLNHSQPSRPGY